MSGLLAFEVTWLSLRNRVLPAVSVMAPASVFSPSLSVETVVSLVRLRSWPAVIVMVLGVPVVPLPCWTDVVTLLLLLWNVPLTLRLTVPALPNGCNGSEAELPVLLLEILALLVRVAAPTFAVMLPALPLLLVVAESVPPFCTVKDCAEMLILPPAPAPCVSVEMPLPAPLITTDSAGLARPCTVTLPAEPVGISPKRAPTLLLLVSWPPLVRLTLAPLTMMLPA